MVKHSIEVDQSGKIELMSVDTIIACSNERQYSIKIPKGIKQDIYYNHKNKVKQIRYKLFCLGIYYCIKGYLSKSESIVIDNEYHGKNNLVKSILLSYIRKDFPYYNHKLISFRNIGKQSNAHHVAIETFRGVHKPNEILTKEQIWRLLK